MCGSFLQVILEPFSNTPRRRTFPKDGGVRRFDFQSGPTFFFSFFLVLPLHPQCVCTLPCTMQRLWFLLPSTRTRRRPSLTFLVSRHFSPSLINSLSLFHVDRRTGLSRGGPFQQDHDDVTNFVREGRKRLVEESHSPRSEIMSSPPGSPVNREC